MRLILDQMLPLRLCDSLAESFESVQHVRQLSLDQATDLEVWEYAREYGLTIVTKDSDFQTLLALHGAPPTVIWLRLGNVSTQSVENALLHNADTIAEFHHRRDGDCLIIRR